MGFEDMAKGGVRAVPQFAPKKPEHPWDSLVDNEISKCLACTFGPRRYRYSFRGTRFEVKYTMCDKHYKKFETLDDQGRLGPPPIGEFDFV